MDNSFDSKMVTAIVAGTVLLIIVNVYVWGDAALPDDIAIYLCLAVLVTVSSLFGTVSGLLIPVAACTLSGIVFTRSGAVVEMVLLVIAGVATGHYSDKFNIRHGGFDGLKILDYVVTEFGISVLIFVCVRPLMSLYLYNTDLKETLGAGVISLLISVGIAVCICLPLLLIFNHFYRKKQMVEDARREFLYHSGKQ